MVMTVTTAAAGLERVLVQSSRTGRIWGNNVAQTVLSAVIPGGAIRPASALKIKGQFNKYAPNNGGWNMVVRVRQGGNTVQLTSAFFTATTVSAPFEHELTLSPDRKWAFSMVGISALNGTGGNQAIGFASTNLISTTQAAASALPRAKAAGPKFASYTTSPTVETVLIDFEQDVTLEVLLTVASSADSAELLAFRLSAMGRGEDGQNLASSKATYCPGDSLTEGTGATSEATGWVSMLGKTRPGRPVVADGLGGQTISQIVDRAVADPICGKYWDLILWAGTNDATGDSAAWWSVMHSEIERLLAFRDPAARHPLILNLHENTAWSAGVKTAADYVNSQLAATYGANVVDIAAVIDGNAGYYSDGVHLNDSGYAAVAAAVDSAMTAQGWAA